METWRSEHTYDLCILRSKPDFKMTGRRSTAGGAADEFAIADSEYADDTALAFCSRVDLDVQAPRVITHFERFGMEVHAGILDTSGPVTKVVKESKTEVLFASAPLHTYEDASTFDGADLSHVLIPGDRYLPIVEKFPSTLATSSRAMAATRPSSYNPRSASW